MPYTLFRCLYGGMIFLACHFQAGAQSAYVRQFRPLADSLSAQFGIPAGVILGIAVIESSNGKSRNCKLLNNHFGIVGKNNMLKTRGIRTRYRQYRDARESYLDFCRLIARKKFYVNLRNKSDYRVWIDAISRSGYSEAPSTWRRLITEAIVSNKLQ